MWTPGNAFADATTQWNGSRTPALSLIYTTETQQFTMGFVRHFSTLEISAGVINFEER